MVWLELLIVLLLIVLNGVLAMSELALVSSRRSRLEQMAASGSSGARVAVRLIEDPGRFLSTVQIGITLVGIVAGAYSGATLGGRLGEWLNQFPLFAPNGHAIAVPLVVVAITYLSLIVGELVPKRIAMASPERVAATIARPMHILSRIASPAVWLLKLSTDAVLRLIGIKPQSESTVTEDEIRALILEGTRAGVFYPQERRMIDGVMRLADRVARLVMTPRAEVVWIDVAAGPEDIVAALEDGPHSRLLVCRGSVEEPVGIVQTKDLLRAALRNEPVEVEMLMVPPIVVPENLPVLRLIELFRSEGVHMAVVVDEFGSNMGVVTPTDLLETITGELPEGGEDIEPRLVQRADGSWLADGLTPIDEFEDHTGIRGLRDTGDFDTLGGFALQQLEHLPRASESFVFRGVRFEVVDLDGHRIDKILVTRLEEGEG